MTTISCAAIVALELSRVEVSTSLPIDSDANLIESGPGAQFKVRLPILRSVNSELQGVCTEILDEVGAPHEEKLASSGVIAIQLLCESFEEDQVELQLELETRALEIPSNQLSVLADLGRTLSMPMPFNAAAACSQYRSSGSENGATKQSSRPVVSEMTVAPGGPISLAFGVTTHQGQQSSAFRHQNFATETCRPNKTVQPTASNANNSSTDTTQSLGIVNSNYNTDHLNPDARKHGGLPSLLRARSRECIAAILSAAPCAESPVTRIHEIDTESPESLAMGGERPSSETEIVHPCIPDSSSTTSAIPESKNDAVAADNVCSYLADIEVSVCHLYHTESVPAPIRSGLDTLLRHPALATTLGLNIARSTKGTVAKGEVLDIQLDHPNFGMVQVCFGLEEGRLRVGLHSRSASVASILSLHSGEMEKMLEQAGILGASCKVIWNEAESNSAETLASRPFSLYQRFFGRDDFDYSRMVQLDQVL